MLSNMLIRIFSIYAGNQTFYTIHLETYLDEFSRSGIDADRIQQQALAVVLAQIGSRQARRLTISLYKWTSIETRLFLAEIIRCLLKEWCGTRYVYAYDADYPMGIALCSAYTVVENGSVVCTKSQIDNQGTELHSDTTLYSNAPTVDVEAARVMTSDLSAFHCSSERPRRTPRNWTRLAPGALVFTGPPHDKDLSMTTLDSSPSFTIVSSLASDSEYTNILFSTNQALSRTQWRALNLSGISRDNVVPSLTRAAINKEQATSTSLTSAILFVRGHLVPLRSMATTSSFSRTYTMIARAHNIWSVHGQ